MTEASKTGDQKPAAYVDIVDHIAVLTLNNPAKRNAVTVPMLDALSEELDGLARDANVRVIVVTGAGNGFCSGADFTAVGELTTRTGMTGMAANHEGIRSFYRVFAKFDDLPQPIVAAINGGAVGGGLAIALMCDIRVMSMTAKIGGPFATLGIPTGLGISAMMPAAMGYEAAAELLFTGELVNGEKAARLGLVRHAVPEDEVIPKAMEIAEKIAAGAPLITRYMKRSLRAATRGRVELVREMESMSQALLSQTADFAEGVSAMLQKRPPKFTGS